jgi:hypothetical protein
MKEYVTGTEYSLPCMPKCAHMPQVYCTLFILYGMWNFPTLALATQNFYVRMMSSHTVMYNHPSNIQ